jgi:GNAT superfamily N-acetyltransferase
VGDRTLVFVGGLHRSGTTPLARCLAAHPRVSGFAATGEKEDEGQHLQSVYPSARQYGGAGRFAHTSLPHLTEGSPLATPENARRLVEGWAPYWDLDRPVLLEKSPPNLVMTRFLQALFPDARFVMMVRHPVVVTLSTHRWRGRTSYAKLLEHWFSAHDRFRADAPHIRNLCVVKYEELVADPPTTLARVGSFLRLDGDVPASSLQTHRSDTYQRQWAALIARAPWQRIAITRLLNRYEERAREYGYSLRDLSWTQPFTVPGCGAADAPVESPGHPPPPA